MSKRNGIFIGSIFILGLIIFIYPHVAQQVNNHIQKSEAIAFHSEAKTLPPEVKHEKIQAARECNEAIFTNEDGLSDPFTEGYNPLDYQECMKAMQDEVTIDMGTIASIEIPKLGLHIPIHLGADEAALSQGVGQVEGSSLPVGGPSTHTVLAGHRGMGTKEMFRHLDELQPGDVFYIHTLDEKIEYEVYDTNVILPYETGSLTIQNDKDLATLLTCHPYRSNTHRLVVHGERK